MIGRRRWLLVLLGATLAWLEVLSTSNAEPAVLAADIAAGLALMCAAVVLLDRDPGRRIGILCAVTGIAWFGGAFTPLLEGAYLGPLAHLIVAYPMGRVRSGLPTFVVAVGYLAGLLVPFAVIDLRGPVLSVAAFIALQGAVRVRGPRRRGRLSGALTGVALTAVAVGTSVSVSQGWLDLGVARIVYAGAVAMGAVWLAVDLRWGGWSQDALARLVIDLGDRAEPSTLRGRLAEVLGDPSLVIGYRVGEGTPYVDEAGLPVEIGAAGPGRIEVPLVAGGAEVGVLIRDARAEIDPLLADGVARAAELALVNARLNAAAQVQLQDLDASRTRLIAAEDTERSRIRFELDGGALRRLGIVEARLAHKGESETSTKLRREVRAVIAQLEEFARGLGAVTPLQSGLDDALRVLADRASVPVTLSVPSGMRWPPLVESTLYFVAAEALTNVERHANATQAWLRVDEIGGTIRLEVVDDGVGSAAPSSGSGLAGLVQRVEATGGRLQIESPSGGGTRLIVELPLDRASEPRAAAAATQL